MCFSLPFVDLQNIIKALILQGILHFLSICKELRIFANIGSSPASGIPKALNFQGFFFL